MYKHILLLLVSGYNKAHSSHENVKQWRTTWRILEISTDVNSKFQIHTEFYIFMSL